MGSLFSSIWCYVGWVACPDLHHARGFHPPNGSDPFTTSLVQGADGNFYGTTTQDGFMFYGAIFRVTREGSLTTLGLRKSHSTPYAGLVLASDGNFYGTTSQGGDWKMGTVYRVTSTGRVTTLHSFGGGSDGVNPYSALIQAADGNLYGTTLSTVFRITLDGSLTTLFTFCSGNCNDGFAPVGGLVQGTDGNFYGTTSYAGDLNCDGIHGSGCGTVFKITRGGRLTTLHVFELSDGDSPDGTLIQASDGTFYGTTYRGGPLGCGTVFQLTSEGVFKTVHSFNSADGQGPVAGLIQGTDGNFYGTTNEGGDFFRGTVFKISPDGQLTLLYSLCSQTNCIDGSNTWTGLLQATNGTFYGMTVVGGTSGNGTVFSLDMGLGPFVAFVRNSGRVGQATGILGEGFTGTTDVSLNGTPATFTVVSDTLIRATIPAGATSGYVTVATPGGTLTSNKPFIVLP